MAQNTSPIFVLTPAIGTATLLPATTANTKSDGTGTIATDLLKAFTANATNGSYVSSVRFNPCASTAATATAATTLRVFISSKTTGVTTNVDTWLFQEVSAAAQTADHSTNATYSIEVAVNRILPASYTILVSTHVAITAATSWQAVVFAGDY